MNPTQYIDIDSTYRNRLRFPNPASFEILPQQDHSCCGCNKCYMLDPVSDQAIIYPNPEENPQISFYEETIIDPFGIMFMMDNLPLMYKTNTDTIIQLDELPIMSTDPTTNNIIENTFYPRNAIPLSTAEEFYTDDYLEDVHNNESRKITKFHYSDDDIIFQTGTVTHWANFDTIHYLYTNVNNITDTPFSNISRYYQGKYLKMISGNSAGESQLIINYIPGQFENTFQLKYEFSGGVNNGDEFQIVSNNGWYATIESPFSNPLPNYPTYREPIPSQNISFYENSIYTSNNIIAYISIMNQYRSASSESQISAGAGIAYIENNGNTSTSSTDFPLGNMYYISATDNDTNNWLSPVLTYSDVFVSNLAVIDINDGSGFHPEIVYSLPKESAAVPPAGDTLIYFTTTYEPFGQYGWEIDGGEGNDYTQPLDSTTPPDRSPVVHAIASYDYVNQIETWVIYNGAIAPSLYYRFGANAPLVVVSSVSPNVIHIFKMLIINNNPCIYYAIGTNYYFVRSSNVSGSTLAADTKYNFDSGYPLGSYFYMSKALDLDMNLVQTVGGTFPAAITVVGASDAISQTLLYVSDLATGQTASWTMVKSWDQTDSDGLQGAKLIQSTIDGILYTFVFVHRTNVGLQFDYSTDFNTASPTSSATWNGIVVIDTSTIYDMEVLNNNNGDLLLVYSRSNGSGSELVSLKINSNTLELARPYRIRKNPAFQKGQENTIISIDSTKTQITLPSYAQQNTDVYKCQYFYLYNANTLDIPTNFNLYNEFIQIIDYDIDTNTITLANKINPDPVIYGIAPYGTVELFLEFKQSAALGNDTSPNNYDFTPGVNSQYIASHADVNGVVLNDVVLINGTANSGLTRNISSDTNIINAFETLNSTISVWVLFNSFAGNPYVLAITQSDHSTIIYNIWYNTGSNELTFNSEGISGIVLNTWYNLTIVFDDNVGTLYIDGVENVTSSSAGMSTITDVTYMDIGSLNNANRLNGYIKNIAVINDQFNLLQVNNIYNYGLYTLYYSLAWEIWTDVYDHCSPIIDPTINVITDMEACYEISLIDLILPNVILKTSFGNLVAFYPYIYVEFTPIPVYNGRLLISNNPHVTSKIIFKVPIRDIADPDRKKFVNNITPMRQVFKFKPTGAFKFAVYLTNGELFTSEEDDSLPPLPPKFLLQVSATFSIRKI